MKRTTLIFICLAAAFACTSLARADLADYQLAVRLEPGLISQYTLDASDLSDDFGSNDGTAQGTVSFTTGVAGGADKAVLLAGDGHVRLQQVPEFDFTDGTGTIEAWVRADWTAVGYNPCIFADRNGGPVNWSVHMGADKEVAGLWNGMTYEPLDIPGAGTRWHYLVVVFDIGSFTWYWDGAFVGSTFQALGASPTSPTQLGSSSDGATTEGWIGALDEVAFYADALAPEVVASHYEEFLSGRLPEITRQPAGGSFLQGVPLELSVEAIGVGLTYRWTKDGTDVPSATNPTLSFASLATGDAGAYRAVVTSSGGSVTSDPAVVSVDTSVPTSLRNYQVAVDAEPSLISYFAFDRLDLQDAAGGNIGTAQGVVGFADGIGGGAGKAVLLGGGGHVRLDRVADFEFSDGTGTVEAWIRADWTAVGYAPCLFANRDGGPVNWSIHMNPDKAGIGLWNGSSYQPFAMPGAGAGWHHVAAVFETGSFKLYWDGAELGTTAQGLGGTFGLPTQLGSSVELATAEGWIGGLDEVAFYADALAAETVKEHYDAIFVGQPPVIRRQPQGGTFLAGVTCQLAVEALGEGLSYRWTKDETDVPGATGATLSFPSLGTGDSGAYRAVVTNASGSVTSDPAVIAVEAALPEKLRNYQAAVDAEPSLISYYPFDRVSLEDAAADHDGVAQGTVAFTEGIEGGAAKALGLDGTAHVRLDRVADFEFSDGTGTIEAWVRADWSSVGYNPCLFANRDGAPVNWSVHMLADKSAVGLWNGTAYQPFPTLGTGTKWYHFAMVFDSGNLTVYWDGTALGTVPQGLGGTFGLPTQLGSSVDLATGEGWIGGLDEVAFYGDALEAGTIAAHYAIVAAGEPPSIRTQPKGGLCFVGSGLELDVAATGPNLSYQWFKGVTAIPGAQGAVYSVASVATSDAGTYHVVVSNPAGSVKSDEVEVSVAEPNLSSYQAAVLASPSLISYYTFDDGDASDTSELHDGALMGDASFGLGLGDQALLLSGAGHVALGPVADFEFSSGIGTIEAWVRADWSGVGYNPCMFANRDGGPVNWSIHMTAGKEAAGVWNGATYQVAMLPTVGNAWHHFVLAFAVGEWSLYIDGQLAGTQSQGLGMTAMLPTQMGSSGAAATAEGWIGAFDEVAFYGDTLDAETVEAHYKAMVEGGAARTPFHRGDANADGAINITDGIYILNYLFLGGPTPPCKEAANPNNDLSVNITDGIYVLNFLFLGGPPPAAPGPTGNPCGVDPEPEGSAGDLGCGSYTKC